jgi:hypothetical protein
VEDSTDAFNLLYKFITGENRQKAKVKMAAPVVSQKIEMTSPVLSETDTMAFVMPAEFTPETTPEPLDNRVKIVEIPARSIAVLRFSGGWSESHLEKEKQELMNELANARIKTKGEVSIHYAIQPTIHSRIPTKKRGCSRNRTISFNGLIHAINEASIAKIGAIPNSSFVKE